MEESREALPPSSQPAPAHHGMMMMMNPHHHHTHNSFAAVHNANSPSLIFNHHSSSMIPNPTFPFNSTITPPQSQSLQQQSKFHDSLNSPPPFDDSSSPLPKHSAFSIESSPSKKKRGRPRKYAPDGNIALGLAPAPNSPSGHKNSEGITTGEPQAKKHKGRPPGSGKKQLNALGIKGVGFTPHVILVNPGEDIALKIMDFSQQGPRTVCVLAANGAICNATLRQQASSGGTVSYEGRFEIVSLSGSYLLSESNGNRTRSGGLSVSLAGSDGRVLGGVVAGMLLAVSPVQVIVGSFIANAKKAKGANNESKADPAVAVVVPVTEGSPTHSQGALSESCSYENETGTTGGYNDCSTNTQQQPIHGMPMYSSSMAWANSLKMHPN